MLDARVKWDINGDVVWIVDRRWWRLWKDTRQRLLWLHRTNSKQVSVLIELVKLCDHENWFLSLLCGLPHFNSLLSTLRGGYIVPGVTRSQHQQSDSPAKTPNLSINKPREENDHGVKVLDSSEQSDPGDIISDSSRIKCVVKVDIIGLGPRSIICHFRNKHSSIGPRTWDKLTLTCLACLYCTRGCLCHGIWQIIALVSYHMLDRNVSELPEFWAPSHERYF